jgi:hypothetical protein
LFYPDINNTVQTTFRLWLQYYSGVGNIVYCVRCWYHSSESKCRPIVCTIAWKVGGKFTFGANSDHQGPVDLSDERKNNWKHIFFVIEWEESQITLTIVIVLMKIFLNICIVNKSQLFNAIGDFKNCIYSFNYWIKFKW